LAAAELFKNADTAALLGARRVMLVAEERVLRYGEERFASIDSCVLLLSTCWSDCPSAVEAKAKVRAATFMLECLMIEAVLSE